MGEEGAQRLWAAMGASGLLVPTSPSATIAPADKTPGFINEEKEGSSGEKPLTASQLQE